MGDPTIADLEKILASDGPTTVQMMPNGEVRALDLKEMCDAIRAELLGIEKTVRVFKDRPEFKGEDAYPGQHGEMIAQSMLAVRHIEDARMRLGKVLQYARDGVSIFDSKESR